VAVPRGFLDSALDALYKWEFSENRLRIDGRGVRELDKPIFCMRMMGALNTRFLTEKDVKMLYLLAEHVELAKMWEKEVCSYRLNQNEILTNVYSSIKERTH
jgi:hypothetical protein